MFDRIKVTHDEMWFMSRYNQAIKLTCDNTDVGCYINMYDNNRQRVWIDNLQTTLASPDGTTKIKVHNSGIHIQGLPTSDPVSVGEMWNSNGFLAISLGP